MEPIQGIANKLPEHAARLAAVIALVDDIDTPAVSTEHLKAGIQLVEYYANEALRLFAAGVADADLLLAKRTLEWLHEKWRHPHVSTCDLYQRGPKPIRDQRTARKIANILDDHGWLASIEGGTVIDGQHRREVWRVMRA
jgi:hypothetical protein